MFEMIKNVVAVLSFVLGWRIWIKVVDRADEFVKRRLSDKSYNRLICALFIIMFFAFLYSII